MPVRIEGKFFWAADKKFYVKGITYGPFAPNVQGEQLPTAEQATRDFAQIAELGANVVRVYHVPPVWLLDLAQERGLKVWIDIPWQSHRCFLDSEELTAEARKAVREAVQSTKGHAAVFAYSVANEISPEIVRWSGTKRVQQFIDELIDIAKSADPQCLCTFTSYPPTEFLISDKADFVAFNVYLHERVAFDNYLRRLQTLADTRPLVLAEFGIDSYREGEQRKGEILDWAIESAFQGGLAGTVLFSYTDDWYRGGCQIEDWGFGLTTRKRALKDSYALVQKRYRAAPYFEAAQQGRLALPKVSVIVATYNGARTLKACLESLSNLNYPDYEIILVDDGSTDVTPEIAKSFPAVRYIHQSNQGLSAARNTGIAAAAGEIIAFTDSDCRADPDWLFYLASELLRAGDGYAGIGGHNFLPPEDSAIAATVQASPGAPAHVMLTDKDAEHIPGCNMAFYKWALAEIQGFDPVFHAAGDDVDVCWRLQERGYKLAFSPAGFVWHYRRSTLRAYLKQQAGYGEAEALLMQKHPERFNRFGGSIWKGRIYASVVGGVLLQKPIIYHGLFASGFFQCLYTPQPALPLMFCTSLGYHGCVLVPLLVATVYFPVLLPLTIASFAAPVAVATLAAVQAKIPEAKQRFWSRPLIGLMVLIQPIVRGWARMKYRLLTSAATGGLPYYPLPTSEETAACAFWTQDGLDRCSFLSALVARLQKHCQARIDSGWGEHDLEVSATAWNRLRLVTVTEDLTQQRRMYRCRLKGGWTARTKLLFALIAAAAAFSIHALAASSPWWWMLLLVLPFFYWFAEDDKLQLQQHTLNTIEDVAAECKWVRLTELPSPDKNEANSVVDR
jgi:GT2 family glycosyltransferase